METILIYFGVVFFSPLYIMLAVCFWINVDKIVLWPFKKLGLIKEKEHNPYCNIDPRCHPAFYQDDDGVSYIGGYKFKGAV